MSFFKIWKAWFCFAWMPLYFGGDSESDSSTNTTNDTRNLVTNTDKRAVASDQAVSLTGDGSVVEVDRSTNFADSSTKSSLTSFIDNSNRSTNFSDSSDRSSSTVNTVTDYGSVGAALSSMGQMTSRAFDNAGLGISGAIDVLKLQTTEGQKGLAAAFEMANKSSQNAQANSAAVLGFANSALKETQAAFSEAKDGGQSKMVMAALGAVAVVGVVYALR
jgi:hypothetical protein